MEKSVDFPDGYDWGGGGEGSAGPPPFFLWTQKELVLVVNWI